MDFFSFTLNFLTYLMNMLIMERRWQLIQGRVTVIRDHRIRSHRRRAGSPGSFSMEHKKLKIIWITLLAAILAVAGCTGIQVSQDYDPAAKFAALHTFRWLSPTQEKTGDIRSDNPLQNARIRAAVERTLQEKGYAKSSAQRPSFLVRYQYRINRRIEADGGAGGIGFGFGFGSYGRHGGIAIGTGSGNRVGEYDQASLVIDFIAPASKALIWRGSGSRRYREYDEPAKADAAVNTLVEKILSQFPPTEDR
jgi:hypothetical protein